MDLDTRDHQVALLERYGPLLTDHQRDVLDLHLGQDWSLAEIAEHQSTSRAAVHDLVRRACAQLEEYEARMGLLADESRRREAAVAMRRRLGDVRRRLERLEAEVARV
jgi:predicted DNA-binding protein YlxM (UPF0122 family)